MSLGKPTPEQASAFAVMLHAGLPAGEAILYFSDFIDAAEAAAAVAVWQRSMLVRKALQALIGKPWATMTLGERMQCALDQHYSQLAHFLHSHHYSEMGPADKAKADSARVALEAKVAGTAGKTDALTRFFDDLQAGKLSLRPPVPVAVAN